MALIKCTECGHEVSDKAQVCMNCGCPVSEIMKEMEARKVLNDEDILGLEDYIVDETLRLPEYIAQIPRSSHNWIRLKDARFFSKLIIPANVKKIYRRALGRLLQYFDIYFEHEEGGFEEPLYFGYKGDKHSVFINYKNVWLQEQFCQKGIKYILYDFESNEVVPFVEREGREVEENVDEKIFMFPYLTEKEREIYTSHMISGNSINIPDGVRFLNYGDFDWKYIDEEYMRRYKEEYGYDEHLLGTIRMGMDIVYINECFFEAAEDYLYVNTILLDDEEEYEALSDEEKKKYQVKPIDRIACECIEKSYAGERCEALGTAVNYRDSKGFDTFRLNGICHKNLNGFYWNPYGKRCEWTRHNTRMLVDKMGFDDMPEILEIPDCYTDIADNAFSVSEWWVQLNTVIFPNQMQLQSGVFLDENENIVNLYIPFTCEVDEEIFDGIERELIVFCEEGSSAEKAALHSSKTVIYYDFQNKAIYEKGQRKINVLRTTLQDICICIKDNPDTYQTIIKLVFGGYDAIVIKRPENAIWFEEEMELVGNVLLGLKMNYVFEW